MIARVCTWGLLAVSAICWAGGLVVAHAVANGAGNPGAAFGSIALCAVGAATGGLWLLLLVVRFIARVWHGEKAKAHHV